MPKLLILALLIACAAACDAQVDADHRGATLAELTGTIRNTRTLPVGEAEVVAFWYVDGPGSDRIGTDAVEVAGSFPARFTLSVYEPPAADMLNDYPGAQLGVAFLIVALAGTDYTDEEATRAGLLGMDTEHLLVYAPVDIPAGSVASYMLRGTPPAGFHLYGVHRPTEEERLAREACRETLGMDPPVSEVFEQCGGFPHFDDFVPLSTDLETPLEIELVDDPSMIQAPNWT